jgi:hypothetical protein
MQQNNVTETVSVLLPCPDYDTYARSTELRHEERFGASLHDAVRLLMRTMCLDFTKADCYDELLEVAMDTLENPATNPQEISPFMHRMNRIAAKAFVSEILTAAEIYMARSMLNLQKGEMGNMLDVSAFHRLNQETYRVDFTRSVETVHDNPNTGDAAPCPSERNDLDTLEESHGFVLMRSSQSTHSTLLNNVCRP